MDSPNVTVLQRRRTASTAVNLRRHSSLPGPLRNIRPPQQHQQRQRGHATAAIDAHNVRLQHLQNFKSNPYVGWFRHAPPLPTVGSKHVLSSPTLDDFLSISCSYTGALKKRRFVTPTTTGKRLQQYDSERRKALQENLKQALKEIKCSRHSIDFYIKEVYLESHCKKRGYLRGGGRSDEQALESLFQAKCAGKESISLKALTRLACWIFDVPIEGSTKCFTDHEGASLVSDDEEDDDVENDNFDTVDGSRFRRSDSSILEEEDGSNHTADGRQDKNSTAGTYLSTQAEAYYALSAVYDSMLIERESSQSRRGRTVESYTDESRLDYEITQMDIVRMNRIASRHLDVESIVRLPVRTYESEQVEVESTPTENRESSQSEQRDPFNDNEELNESTVASAEDGDKQDTEFSWMLVPPPQTTNSFDDHTVIEHEDRFIDERNETSTSSQQGRDTSSLAVKDDVCVICLECFVPGDRMRVLPCTHSFHVGCIDRWLSGSHSFNECYTAGCPTCKKRPVQLPLQQQSSMPLTLDGSVPSWAFARIGDILANDYRHF